MSQTSDSQQWKVFDSADEVAVAVKEAILKAAEKAIIERDTFKIVLAGGTTPEQVYSLLATETCDWGKWQIYLGDERCLPRHDPERNSEIISQCFLNRIVIPAENIHFIASELGPEAGAAQYSSEIAATLPFDLVLLGMGEDGHTASLFPGHTHNEDELVHAVYDSPKPPPERISLSAASLGNSLELIKIITGKSKREAIGQWRAGKKLPISSVFSTETTRVMLDHSAFPSLGDFDQGK